MIGDKHDTEALDVIFLRECGVVEEHCQLDRSGRVTDRGLLTREYVDMSNDKPGEIPGRRKPKVSRATFFVPGLVGT